MKRNISHFDAPSSVAASYSEGCTVCRPASSVIATNGTPRQILAKITQMRAQVVSPRKLMFCEISPRCFSDHEMIENCESKIHQNASADSTVGTMNGIRTSARSIALNGMFSLSSSARYRPTANLIALATKVKSSVLKTESQKIESSHSHS